MQRTSEQPVPTPTSTYGRFMVSVLLIWALLFQAIWTPYHLASERHLLPGSSQSSFASDGTVGDWQSGLGELESGELESGELESGALESGALESGALESGELKPGEWNLCNGDIATGSFASSRGGLPHGLHSALEHKAPQAGDSRRCEVPGLTAACPPPGVPPLPPLAASGCLAADGVAVRWGLEPCAARQPRAPPTA
jgi:hypothetical protein